MAFEDKINGKCPVETTFRILSGKYKSAILWALRDGCKRYTELRQMVPKASPKMLAEQLHEMEKDGLITKTIYPVVPPKTEYALTVLGAESIPVLELITKFGTDYLHQAGEDVLLGGE